MELFINELSLHGQYFQTNEFEKAIRNLLEINNLVTKKVSIWHTESNYLLYQTTISPSVILLQSLEKLNNDFLKEAFKKFLFSSIQNWNLPENRLHSSQDIFVCPILNDEIVTDSSLAEVAERKLQTPDIQRVLINFIESKFKGLEQISVFKNDEKEENPIELDCLDSKQEFEKKFPLIFRHNPKHDLLPQRAQKGDAYINRLLCTHEQATKLLFNAISDGKKRFNIDCFEDSKGFGKIVEFMPENIEKTIYHAYHLEDVIESKDVDRYLSYLSSEIRDKLKLWLKKS